MGSVFVPGTPVPQGSAKGFAVQNKATGKYRAVVTHANSKTMPWRDTVSSFVREEVGDSIPFPSEPVAVEMTFFMPRRAAEPKRVTPAHTRKPDIDKLQRAILDSLTGIVFTDDSQVTRVTGSKRTAAIGEQPGVFIFWSGDGLG